LLIVLQPIGKWYNRLVHLTGWLIIFRFVRFERIRVDACVWLCWVGFVGVDIDYQLFFWPQCMNSITLIQRLILSQTVLVRIS